MQEASAKPVAVGETRTQQTMYTDNGAHPSAADQEENPDINSLNQSTHYRRYLHIVVKYETLWNISQRYLRNPFRYPELAKLSKIENPHLIYPGDEVIILVKK